MASPSPCRFFLEDRCIHGNHCRFSHVADPKPTRLPPPTDGPWGRPVVTGSRTRAGPAPAAEANDGKAVCIYFQRGYCSRGETCLYQHGTPERKALRDNWRQRTQSAGSAGPTALQEKDIFIPCKFYQMGHCRDGLTCRYQHVLAQSSTSKERGVEEQDRNVELTAAEQTKPVKSQIDEDENLTRTFGGLQAEFRDGFEMKVRHEYLSSASTIISIHHIASTISRDNIRDLLEPVKANLTNEAVRLGESSGDEVYATVNLEDPEIATRAVKKLDGFIYAERKLSVKTLPRKGTCIASEDATRVTCSWFAPSRMAYAHYRAYADAQLAAGKKLKLMNRNIDCKLQRPLVPEYVGLHRSSNTTFSVQLRGLHPDTTERRVKSAMRCSSVSLEEPTFSLSEGETMAYIRSLFEKSVDEVDTFQIVSDPGSAKPKVIVRFRTAQDARRACSIYGGKEQSFLGGGPLFVDLVFSATFKVLGHIFRTVKGDLIEMARKCRQDNYVTVKFFEGSGGKYVTVRIYGSDRQAVANAKVEVQKLLLGSILYDSSQKPLWDNFFCTKDGIRQLKEVMESTGTYIHLDTRTRRLSLYGTEKGRNEAQQAIEAALSYRQKAVSEISLDLTLLRNAVQGGLQELQKTFGDENARLDVARRILVFRGSPEVTAAAQMMLSSYVTGHQEQNEVKSEDECVVCFCDATDPIKLACEHVYCRNCLHDYMLSAIDTRKYPIACFGTIDSPNCNCCIPLKVLQYLLAASELENMIEARFADFVQAHSAEYQYCPTPDCSYVYATTSTGEAVTCSECFIGICTTCKVEAHDGQTCAQYRALKDDDRSNKLFMKWKSESGAKECPSCSASIEKISGCNHVTCANCKKHMCWICLGIFDANDIYEHMREKHGSIYD